MNDTDNSNIFFGMFTLNAKDVAAKKPEPPAAVRARHGLWKEDSALDRLDKKISMPIFTLEVPFVVECVLTVIGTWFGIPSAALILLPLAAAAAHDARVNSSSRSASTALFCGMLGLFLCIWIFLARKSLRTNSKEEIGGFLLAYKPGESRGSIVVAFLLVPHIAIVLCKLATEGAAVSQACWAVMSWLIACGVNEILKSVMKRRRPVVVDFDFERLDAEGTPASPITPTAMPFRDALLHTRRHFSELQRMLRDPQSSHSSMPSGDATAAASGMVVMLSVIDGFDGTWGTLVPAHACIAAAVACSAAFGRVFFHAHHVLDVVLGLLWGTLVTLLLLRTIGSGAGELWSWSIVTGAQLITVVMAVVFSSPSLKQGGFKSSH